MSQFNPNDQASESSGIFGLECSFEESKLVFLPVPWEATTSYGAGTSNGPSAILEASHQLDLYDSELGKVYEAGITLLEEDPEIKNWNEEAKQLVQTGKNINKVNELSSKLNQWVYFKTKELLQKNKIVGLIGGDHSVPYGAYQAIAETEKDFGFLHFDAHFDLRQAYQGYTHSHASIFYNTTKDITQAKKIVHVGIRDFCEEELNYATEHSDRHSFFLDSDLSDRAIKGESWDTTANQIVSQLPKRVWVSFDIDGLDPKYCPNTGTPVPGGLEFNQACYLIKKVVESGRTIIGFDLCEVSLGQNATSDWDANVGMRLLYKLSGWTLKSQNLI